MHNKISQGIVESRLRLDWSNLLKIEISKLRAGNNLSYIEAKATLRKRLGFTKDALNSHLEGNNTVSIINFLYGCHILGVIYVIDHNGQSQFINSDSIFNISLGKETGISIVAGRDRK